VTFNPTTTLFFLAGGLNDHNRITQDQANAATMAQVATLYSLGARLFEIALLPSLVPPFSDSANNLNPGFRALVPELQAQFPGAVFGLSNWGPFFDDILTNPSHYGITNTTDPCLVGMTACSDPDKHFYYFAAHPSDVSHHIVGNELFTEVLALPTPVPGPIVGAGLPGLILACGGLVALARRRRKLVA
jgi:cholinesterase